MHKPFDDKSAVFNFCSRAARHFTRKSHLYYLNIWTTFFQQAFLISYSICLSSFTICYRVSFWWCLRAVFEWIPSQSCCVGGPWSLGPGRLRSWCWRRPPKSWCRCRAGYPRVRTACPVSGPLSTVCTSTPTRSGSQMSMSGQLNSPQRKQRLYYHFLLLFEKTSKYHCNP